MGGGTEIFKIYLALPTTIKGWGLLLVRLIINRIIDKHDKGPFIYDVSHFGGRGVSQSLTSIWAYLDLFGLIWTYLDPVVPIWN